MLRPSAARPGRLEFEPFQETDPSSKSKKRHQNGSLNYFDEAPVSGRHLLTTLAVVLFLQFLMKCEMHRLPPVPDPVETFRVAPQSIDKAVLDTDHFVVARARRSLNELTSFGIRLAGTTASEEMAVPWLLRELDSLKRQLKPNSPHKLSFSADYVSGFFDLNFLSRFTSVYSNVSNVLVRLDPVNGDTKNALLLNAHYDTHFDTVGASDDAVNCAIMLEVLRALMSSPTSLRHSVIFLFNGAEENILQASNGFVEGSSDAGGNVEGAGHPWAKDVRAFINMEAAGSGGRELLFQTGPGPATPILVRAYASSAPYPFANVVGQEIFQSDVIPSDTDFRIFRDHGRIPGIDFAFYMNGYIYHTRYDTPDRIPDGTLQRAGSNILAVTRELASSDLSKMPPVLDPHDRSGEKLVYFDIFSKYFILYPFQTVGVTLNLLAIAGTLWRVSALIFADHKRDGVSYGRIFGAAIIAHFVALTASLSVSLAIASFLSSTSGCMAWYGKPWLIAPIYVFPAVVASSIIHSIFFKHFMIPSCSTANFVQKCETGYEVSFDAALLVSSIGIAILTAYGVASSYILLIWVGFPIFSSMFMDRLVPLGKNARCSSISLLLRHASMTIIPTTYFLYVTYGVYEFFVPITGRIGTVENPEMIISIINFLIMIIYLVFHCPLVYLFGGRIHGAAKVLLLISAVTISLCVLTPFGHPYGLDVARRDGVHIQRSAVLLTMQRIIKATEGENDVVSTRSGLWFFPLDYNGLEPLKGHSTQLDQQIKKARLACSSEKDLQKSPYCGLPYVFPMTGFVGNRTYWIDMEPSEETRRIVYWPTISQMPTSPMRTKTKGRWLLQYRADCGDTPHCSLFVSPHSHATLLRWHFSNQAIPIGNFPIDKMVPPPPGATDHAPRPTWFVVLRFGSSFAATRLQQRSIIVTMEVEATSGDAVESGRDLLDFSVASQYFRGSSSSKDLREFPVELKSFVDMLPTWHCTIPITSLYSGYTF